MATVTTKFWQARDNFRHAEVTSQILASWHGQLGSPSCQRGIFTVHAKQNNVGQYMKLSGFVYSNIHAKINSVDGQTSDNRAWT